MKTPIEPYYETASSELADWIEQQGGDVWWNVDGDPLLTGRLSFPSPGDELAEVLRRLKKPIFVLVRNKDANAKGEIIRKERLDRLAGRLGEGVQITGPQPPWSDNRVFLLRWKGTSEDWLLIEDQETTESSRADVAAATKEN